jgi:hypothetical protein
MPNKGGNCLCHNLIYPEYETITCKSNFKQVKTQQKIKCTTMTIDALIILLILEIYVHGTIDL